MVFSRVVWKVGGFLRLFVFDWGLVNVIIDGDSGFGYIGRRAGDWFWFRYLNDIIVSFFLCFRYSCVVRGFVEIYAFWLLGDGKWLWS